MKHRTGKYCQLCYQSKGEPFLCSGCEVRMTKWLLSPQIGKVGEVAGRRR